MHPFFPTAAMAVAWLFSFQLGRQWRQTRQGHLAAWSVSLFLFGVAHMAVLAAITSAWLPVNFAVYWIAGALLNVPFLALGQLLILNPRNASAYWFGIGVMVGVAFTAVTTASFNTEALAASGIPAGKDVLEATMAYALLLPYTATFLIVVVGVVWSAWSTRRPMLLLIAVGTSIAAAGSSVIDSSYEYLFPVLSAAGVTTMYLGFRATSMHTESTYTKNLAGAEHTDA